MVRTRSSILLTITLGAPLAAQAQTLANRTYVSSKGADSNACSLIAPCRTFPRGIAQTAAGGEVVALDSAVYGTVTITKAISIVNDGLGTAVVQAPANGAAITINVSSGQVNLRGLEIDGQNGNGVGIQVKNGDVSVSRSTITRTGTGLNIFSGNQSKVIVSESTFSDSNSGISANRAGGVTIDRTVFSRMNGAVSVIDVTNVSIKHSVFSNATSYGVFTTGINKVIAIEDSQFSMCAKGIVNGTAIVLIGRNLINGNGTGVEVGTGQVLTEGTNQIRGNGPDVNGSLTPAGPL